MLFFQMVTFTFPKKGFFIVLIIRLPNGSSSGATQVQPHGDRMPGLHQGRLPGFQVSARINQSSAAVEKNLACEEFQLSGATTVRAYMVGNGATGGNIVLMQVMRWTANGPRWGVKRK